MTYPFFFGVLLCSSSYQLIASISSLHRKKRYAFFMKKLHEVTIKSCHKYVLLPWRDRNLCIGIYCVLIILIICCLTTNEQPHHCHKNHKFHRQLLLFLSEHYSLQCLYHTFLTFPYHLYHHQMQ